MQSRILLLVVGLGVLTLSACGGVHASPEVPHFERTAQETDYGYLAPLYEEVAQLRTGDLIFMRDGRIYRVQEVRGGTPYVRTLTGGSFPIFLNVNHQLYQILRIVRRDDSGYAEAAVSFVNQG